MCPFPECGNGKVSFAKEQEKRGVIKVPRVVDTQVGTFKKTKGKDPNEHSRLGTPSRTLKFEKQMASKDSGGKKKASLRGPNIFLRKSVTRIHNVFRSVQKKQREKERQKSLQPRIKERGNSR